MLIVGGTVINEEQCRDAISGGAGIIVSVAITLRSSISANDNDWAGMLYDREDYSFSKSYHLHIVDRVGGGDSFGGGLIYSILSGKTSQETIELP